jgi:gluconate kinase
VHLWVFFGQSGAGKSFVARICAEEFGFEQYDGDRDLTAEMLLAVRESRLFTTEMRATFVAVLSRGIRERRTEAVQGQRSSRGLAVCQGLFKIRDRNQLQANFPRARLVWVRASEELIETRLRQRAGHIASSEYARLVNGGFEPPPPNSDVLENDGDRARIVEQLRRYLH